MGLERLNSPNTRDVAYHVHPAPDLAQLAEKGLHIFQRGEGIYVVDDAQRFLASRETSR